MAPFVVWTNKTRVLVVGLCLLAWAGIGAQGSFPSRPPADVTNTQDRDQMMGQLGVSFPTNLPPKETDPNRPTIPLTEKYPAEPGRSYLDEAGNTIVRDAFGLWVNYDDAKAGTYTPLDLLKMRDGTRIRTAAEWPNAFKFMGPMKEGRYLPRKVEMLPVDGESLIALAAPRPVFLNGGTTDTWSDAPGTYLAGVAASPVYELLGKKGLINPDGKLPKPDVAYLEGDLGYRVHTGGHTPAPDWPAFVDFTRKYFNGKN